MERRRAARLSSPTWVEAGVSHPGAAAEDVTASPPPSAAPVPPKEGSTTPSPFPFGMRSAAATYASSVSTNMSAYEDLPGHHLILIRNIVASTPDDSYPESTDDAYFFMENVVAPEWDYSGVRDLGAFLSFHAAADYCLTCSDDTSEGDYDPTWECSMVELVDGHVDDTPSNGENGEEHPPANQVVVPPCFVKLGGTAGAAGATKRA